MGLKEIQELKERAKEPKVKKPYSIPKVSKKRAAKIEQDKELLKLDKEFYKEVYAASPHFCYECGCKLPKEPATFMFHHLLEKRNFPQFRHEPLNIALVCLTCHSKAETNLDFAPKIRKLRDEVEKRLLP